jgi:Radical SAM superfamily
MPDRLSHDLFDFAPPPTTRDVARLVKAGGITALPDAVQRGDAATYQEIRCRSALNRAHGMPFFTWTLNPYRGCTHGCHYCFARKYQPHLELGAGDDFASVIFVKTNLVEVLRRELASATQPLEQVALGTATDPYQPIEGTYALTRGCLEAFRDHPAPLGIVTKGPMVVRDIDVLRDLSAKAACHVYLSVPSLDDDAWRRLEPGTAPPLQRLRAVRALVDAGIPCSVPRGDDQGGRGPRCRVGRRDGAAPRSRRPASLHAGARTGIPAPGARLRAALHRQVRAEALYGRGRPHGRTAEGPLRRAGAAARGA